MVICPYCQRKLDKEFKDPESEKSILRMHIRFAHPEKAY